MASNWDINGYELNHWWLTKDVPSFLTIQGLPARRPVDELKVGMQRESDSIYGVWGWFGSMKWESQIETTSILRWDVCFCVWIDEARPTLVMLPGCLYLGSTLYTCVSIFIYIYTYFSSNNHAGMLWNYFHLHGLNNIVYTGCYVSIPGLLCMDTLLYMYDIYFIWYTCVVDEHTIHGLIGEVTFGSPSLGKSLMVRFYMTIVDYQRIRVGIWVWKCILQ